MNPIARLCLSIKTTNFERNQRQRRDLWEVVIRYENQPFVQISTHKEIYALTKSIPLYERLPLILNNNSNNDKLSDIIYEDTTSLYPEVSVK